MSGLARVWRTVAVGGLLAASVLGGAVLGATPAAASDAEDAITRYDVTIELDDDGVAHVALDLTVDFGLRPNHGPYLTYVVKEWFDDEQDRVYRIRDLRVSSRTAPDGVETEEIGGYKVTETAFKIGDEDTTITGVHEYTVTYDVEGWVNSASYPWQLGPLENDELYLDLISGWDIQVRDIGVTVVGPAEPLQVACFVDRLSDAPCAAAAARGQVASFKHDAVAPFGPLTIAVAYPAGTFGDVEPILQDRWAAERAFSVNPATGALAGVVMVGGGAMVIRRARSAGRDEQFLGLTPGLMPAGEQPVAVGARRREAVAVQFAPPAGFHAGQLGTLVDEKADPHDVTATIIDLAVRQYLRIVRLAGPDGGADDGDWRLDRSDKPTGDLLPFEALLLDEIFASQPSVVLSDLKTTFATSMTRVQDALYADVTDRGWFRTNPKHARNAWAGAGVGLLLLGIAVTAGLAIWTRWALVGLPVVLLGILVLTMTGMAPARTAAGTAVLAQAKGFRLYLETAEANQLRFEEGEDLFSRYLPYAVAFGLTERWAALFAQLAAQGRALAEPTWYIGPYYGVPFWAMAGTLGNDLSSFTSAADSALTAPAPGASGGSGFSGGGFGGGGVGGGGGGTW